MAIPVEPLPGIHSHSVQSHCQPDAHRRIIELRYWFTKAEVHRKKAGWMRECWVGGNRRAFAVAAALPALAVVAGAGLLAVALGIGADIAVPRGLLATIGAVLLGIGLLGVSPPVFLMRTPRLAYENGRLLVFLRPAHPESLPVEAVECFFLGREPLQVGSRPGFLRPQARVSNIVVRLAEADRGLRERADTTRFGGWRDGYIILDGAWCEPITPELMKRINGRLAEVHRERKPPREATA